MANPTVTSSLKPQISNRLYKLNRLYQQPIARVSTALLLTVFAIVFFAAAAIRPTLATIAELLKKIDDQQTVKTQLDQKVAALATAQVEYSLVQNDIPLVDSAIPNSHKLDELLKQIESTAGVVQIPISSIQVDTVALKTKTPPKSDELIAIPLSVNLEASYEQLSSFLNLIANLSRIITIETITFSQSDTQSQVSQVGLTIQMNAYFFPMELLDTTEL
jgi:Tfp pilus assembly protein PilO